MLQDLQVDVSDGGLDNVLDTGNHGLGQVAEAAVLGSEQHVSVLSVLLQVGIQGLAQLGQSCAVQDDVNIAALNSGGDGSNPVVPGAGFHDDLNIGILLVPCSDQLVVAGHLNTGDQVDHAVGAHIDEVGGTIQTQGNLLFGSGSFSLGSLSSGGLSLGGLGSSGGSGAATGSQGQNHDQCQQHSNQLFHCVSS